MPPPSDFTKRKIRLDYLLPDEILGTFVFCRSLVSRVLYSLASVKAVTVIECMCTDYVV